MEKLVSIGKILNFHGIQGEVKVGYTANKEKQLSEIKEAYAVKDSKIIPLTVEKIRFHKKLALIKFKEISSVNDAIELKGAYLKIPKSELKDYLEEDEFYIDDLVGLDVFDTEGNYIGQISYIANIRNEDLITIKDQQGQEHLVPFVKELVPEVKIQERKVIVKKIPGLIEEGKE